MVSLWSLAVVAFERFLVICKPLGNFTFRGTHAIIGCLLTWIFGLVASAPPLFGWSRGRPCPPWISVGPRQWLLCPTDEGGPQAMAAVPLHESAPHPILVAKQQEQSATTQKAEREVTKMVVVMVAGFLVCWLPYASFALWVVTHRGEPFDVHLASIPAVFSKSSTVYNPIIYVFMNKQVDGVVSVCVGERVSA
ncbi:Blue-sensitive opsin [Chelonia mydas]|uniref:Blue-sensitive opsin n=1 Tax=Chelonia mydas TaxID=8469 RepID=M7CCM1_CHEMY|nr:Blue-sensitive opsin [Chelonia mydas]